MGRKIIREEGESARALIGDIRALDGALASNTEPAAAVIRSTLDNGANGLAQVVDWLLDAANATRGCLRLLPSTFLISSAP